MKQTNTETAKRFSDFASKDDEPIFPDAERIEFEKVLNKEVKFLEIKELQSQYEKGKYVVVKAEDQGFMISFGISGVIAEQLLHYNQELPFLAKIVQKKSKSGRRYYSLE